MRLIGAILEGQKRLAQSGARCDYRNTATGNGSTLVEGMHVIGCEDRYGGGHGFEIVHEADGRDLEGALEVHFVDYPGQVGGLSASLDHGTGDVEQSSIDLRR